jgi:signal transduction histidine kinase
MGMENNKTAVIVVDDNPDDLQIFLSNLFGITKWEINCYSFASWQAAEQELDSLAYEIIFISDTIGINKVLEIIKKFRSAKDYRPIIVMAKKGSEAIAVQFTKAGADNYFVKNEITSKKLSIVITKALAGYYIHQEKKIKQRQLLRAHEMETIGTFASGIAHDFSNMLIVIKGFINAVSVEGHSNKARKSMAAAKKACLQMEDIVNKLLTFNRTKIPDYQQVNVHDAIELAEGILQNILPQTIDLNLSFLSKSPIVMGRTYELQQVILNLVNNAVDAMEGKGRIEVVCSDVNVDINFSIKHKDLIPGDYICIEVRDYGKGIKKDEISRIFEPFYSTKTLGIKKGTGLGLALVWQIVRDHLGSVFVESEIGSGVDVKVYIPAVSGAKIKDLKDLNEVVVDEGAMTKNAESILIVDDSTIVRNYLANSLGRLGYKIYLAANGEEATKMFSKLHETLGCVILDVIMPVMDGKTCLANIKCINSTVPVMMITGNDITDTSTELYAQGATAIMKKPFNMQELVTRIKAII